MYLASTLICLVPSQSYYWLTFVFYARYLEVKEYIEQV